MSNLSAIHKVNFIEGIDSIAAEVHSTCVSKGFWPQDKSQRNLGEALMLINTELSEWLEGVRQASKGSPMPSSIEGFSNEEEEAADVLIRLMDLCEGRGIRLALATLAKMDVNAKRPFKHGKAF